MSINNARPRQDTMTALTTMIMSPWNSNRSSPYSPLSIGTTIGSVQLTCLPPASQTSLALVTSIVTSSTSSTTASSTTSSSSISVTSASSISTSPSPHITNVPSIILPSIMISGLLLCVVICVFLYRRRKLGEKHLDFCPYQATHRLWLGSVLIWKKAKQTRIRNRGIRARSRAGSDICTDEKSLTLIAALRKQTSQRQRWSDDRYPIIASPEKGFMVQAKSDCQRAGSGAVCTPTSQNVSRSLSTPSGSHSTSSELHPTRISADTDRHAESTDPVVGLPFRDSPVADLESLCEAGHEDVSRDEQLRKAAMERFHLQDLTRREQQANRRWDMIFSGPSRRMRALWDSGRQEDGDQDLEKAEQAGQCPMREEKGARWQQRRQQHDHHFPNLIKYHRGRNHGSGHDSVRENHVVQPEITMPRISSITTPNNPVVSPRRPRNSIDTDDLRTWFGGLGVDNSDISR